MPRISLQSWCLVGLLLGANASAQVVINEIDYDQTGPDGAEFVELYNSGAAPVDLSGYTVQLVNGSSGSPIVYRTIDLPMVSLAPGDFFVICANSTTVADCDLDADPDTNFIQNGSSDAVALFDAGPALVDTVSYEGDVPGFVEVSGSALIDTGDGSIARTTDGVDSNNNNCDFTFLPITPGNPNSGAPVSELVINEIDYDQIGPDTAEFVEIYNSGASPIDLDGYTLEFINGSNSVAYRTITLPAVVLAPDDYFVVCANIATTANCDLDADPDTNFIQNGAPDAVILRDPGTDLVDVVSYEGDVPGFVEGSGAGLVDTGDGSIARIPNGVDNNTNNADFQFLPITPGENNENADSIFGDRFESP